MGHLTVRARGPLSAAVVWERYAEPALWQTWAPHIRSVEFAGPCLVGGARGWVVGPLSLRVSFVVDSVDEAARTWSWTVTVILAGKRVVSVRLHHVVSAAGSGTSTSLRLDGPAIVIAGYAPIAWYALRRLTR